MESISYNPIPLHENLVEDNYISLKESKKIHFHAVLDILQKEFPVLYKDVSTLSDAREFLNYCKEQRINLKNNIHNFNENENPTELSKEEISNMKTELFSINHFLIKRIKIDDGITSFLEQKPIFNSYASEEDLLDIRNRYQSKYQDGKKNNDPASIDFFNAEVGKYNQLLSNFIIPDDLLRKIISLRMTARSYYNDLTKSSTNVSENQGQSTPSPEITLSSAETNTQTLKALDSGPELESFHVPDTLTDLQAFNGDNPTELALLPDLPEYGPHLPPPIPDIYPKIVKNTDLGSFLEKFKEKQPLSTKLYQDGKAYDCEFAITSQSKWRDENMSNTDPRFSICIYPPNGSLAGFADGCLFEDNSVYVTYLANNRNKDDKARFNGAGTAIIEALFRISVLTGRGGNITLTSDSGSSIFYYKVGLRAPDSLLRPGLKEKFGDYIAIYVNNKAHPENRLENLEKIRDLGIYDDLQKNTYYFKWGYHPKTKEDWQTITEEDVLDHCIETMNEYLGRLSMKGEKSPDLTFEMSLATIGKASFWHTCFGTKDS